MRNSFDYYKQVEKPNMYLCNPDRTPIGFVNSENRHLVLRFNDLSELTFTVPKITGTEGVYDRVETKRLLFIEKIGWFQITNVVNTVNGERESKEVTAESHQTQLKTRGFITEERVYMFYNPNDPLDEKYDSGNLSAMPSVVGQLYQQLGIKVNLQLTDIEPTKDYDEWTLTYIDPVLKFSAKSYDKQYESADGADNLCRSFTENETFGYDFIVNDVESAFEVVFEFDFLYHTIKVKRLEEITQVTNIYLSLDNVLESISVSENAENIVTVLSCNGNDLDIRTVNPMGTNYIVNFDYYKKEISNDGKIKYPWMSKELVEALNQWEAEWKKWQIDDSSRTEHPESYSTLVDKIQKLYTEQAGIESNIQYANLKLTDLQAARDSQIKQDSGTNNGKGIVTAEDVAVGNKSLSTVSSYNTVEFSEMETITTYLEAPSVSDDYIFSFSGDGKTETAKSMLLDFIGNEEESDGYYSQGASEAYLYFSDDSTKKSYCKILVAAEIGVVKDSDGNIGADGTAEVKGVTFTVKSSSNYFKIMFPDETSTTVSKSNSYFIYNGTRYKIVESSDGITTIYCFYVAGFRRFTTYKQLTGEGSWCDIWERYVGTIDAEKDTLDSQIKIIQEKMEYISEICHVQKFIKRCGDSLYNEFSNYWVEGEYSNDNLATNDSTTIAERIALAKELMKSGKKELAKVSQPTFELSVSAVNFIKILEFKPFTDELELGRVITIEKDEDTHYRPALVSIEYNLDSADSFSLTFSTAAKLDETEMTFADLLNQSSSTSRTVSANWSNLTDYWKNKDKINSLLNSPLDRTLRATQANMSNQEFTIDLTGILGRKWSDDSHTSFEKEQVRIMNNTIMFTDDNWQTIRAALGKISYDEDGEEKQAYGLIAEVLVGSLLLGEQLNIRDKNNSILLNKDGISINKGNENVFKASTDGDVFVKGKIEATSGKFGSLTIDEDGAIDATYFLVTKDGEVKATKGTIGVLTVNENGSISTSTGNFTLSENGVLSAKEANIEGHIDATSGNIGAFEITKDGLESQYIHLNSEQLFFPTQTQLNLNNEVLIYDSTSDPTTKVATSYIVTQGAKNFEIKNASGAGLRFMANTQSQKVSVNLTISNPRVTITSTVIGSGQGVTAYSNKAILFLDYKFTGTQDETTALPAAYQVEFYTKHDNGLIFGDTAVYTKRSYTIPANNGSGTISFEFFTYTSTTGTGGVSMTPSYDSTEVISWTESGTYGSSLSKSIISIDNSNTALYSLGSLFPRDTDCLLGDGSHKWGLIAAESSIITTSDRRFKNSISEIAIEYETFFDLIKPVTYKFNNGSSNRFHTGFIAQDVENALYSAGLTTKDFAGLCIDDTSYSLRYEEFIALNTAQIQKLKSRVSELENIIKELKGE